MHATSIHRAAEAATGATLVDHTYRIDPSMDARDVYERLSDVVLHLRAQLTLITGGGQDTFRGFDAAMQDQYLYGCARQAQEVADLLKLVGPAVYRRTH